MKFFEKIGVPGQASIDWDITPELTFTMFESWGSRLWIRSLDERYYYFYIDNWKKPAKLCLMERGLKFAKVLAEINAPHEMIDSCVASQGKKIGLDKSFSINSQIKNWLLDNVLNTDGDTSKVKVLESAQPVEDMNTGLPEATEASAADISVITLRGQSDSFGEDRVVEIVKSHNFFDVKRNSKGNFVNHLVDNGDNLTVTDLATGLMWQRGGSDITSVRNMQKNVEKYNKEAFAGFTNWRMPTVDEALSIMEPQENVKGHYVHKSFSKDQPFVFLADQRQPGGHWFADFNQGCIFWASGTNPGGFGRFCRTI